MPKIRKCEIIRYNNTLIKDKIMPADLTEGTITISNIGSIYKNLKGTLTLLEVIPPQVLAIGIGAIENGQLTFCFSFDHRALNFNDIIPFIKKLDYIFESGIVTKWF